MKRRIIVLLLFYVLFVSLKCQIVQASQTKTFKKIASGVTNIACGESNIVFKKNKNAYVVGYDGRGCMGYGDDKMKQKVVMRPNLIGKKVKCVFGSSYMVAYTKKRDVFLCGDGYLGEFYEYYDSYYEPECFVPPQGYSKIKKMWLADGTLAYGIDNDLWVSGLVLNGSYVTPRQKPKRILKNKLDQVKTVSVSMNYVIINYKDGSAEVMGEDRCGKSVKDKTSPYLYEKPVPLNRFDSKVQRYIAGFDNIGAITNNGDFYIWGSNEYGFLCDKSLKKTTNQPRCVLKDVKDVIMTYEHVLALKKDGTVWSWGKNYLAPSGGPDAKIRDSAYTIDSSKKKIITKPVKIASDVKQIAEGSEFSVILKKNGTAYWRGTISGI